MASFKEKTYTLLVTGFEPFDENHALNPSYEIARSLPRSLTPSSSCPATVRIICYPSPLPVDYDKIKQLVPKLLLDHKSVDMVLHIGMISSRSYYSIEEFAHRNGYDQHKDNGGKLLEREQGSVDFPDCLETMFSSYTFDELLRTWQQCTNDMTDKHGSSHRQQLRASEDAGHFLCDYTYYNSLAWFARQCRAFKDTRTKSRPVLFLHVPADSDEASLRSGRLVTCGLIRAMAVCLESYSDKPHSKPML